MKQFFTLLLLNSSPLLRHTLARMLPLCCASAWCPSSMLPLLERSIYALPASLSCTADYSPACPATRGPSAQMQARPSTKNPTPGLLPALALFKTHSHPNLLPISNARPCRPAIAASVGHCQMLSFTYFGKATHSCNTIKTAVSQLALIPRRMCTEGQLQRRDGTQRNASKTAKL